jgi:hypothetical protein
MLGVLLVLLLIAFGVAVLVAAGTAVIQGYLYTQPVQGIAWRSAVTGLAVGLFFGGWCWLESRSPGVYGSILDFSPQQMTVFPEFWSERTGDRGKQEILYRQGHDARGRSVYLDADNQIWQRSSSNGMMTAIIVEESGEKHRFEAELTSQGTFKTDDAGAAHYVEQNGRRVMTDGEIGRITTTRYGVLFGNLALNFAHLLVWWLCLWLLMEFDWWHALGMAVALWLAFGLALWPVVRDRVPHQIIS